MTARTEQEMIVRRDVALQRRREAEAHKRFARKATMDFIIYARSKGYSWQQIGPALSISAEAAAKFYDRNIGDWHARPEDRQSA